MTWRSSPTISAISTLAAPGEETGLGLTVTEDILCLIFLRSVSYPTPTYYSHLAADRARKHHNELMDEDQKLVEIKKRIEMRKKTGKKKEEKSEREKQEEKLMKEYEDKIKKDIEENKAYNMYFV